MRCSVWMACAARLVLAAAVAVTAAAGAQESFNTTPPPVSSDFSCSGRPMGYYADLDSNCRAYHTCDDHGNHFTHHCPEDTAFRQDAMICDHAYLVDCRANAESAPPQPRHRQDDSHDAPASSFVEPRGEGTSSRGYARSFRIKPDARAAAAPGGSKYPTFVLNSSVFLANREPAAAAAPKREHQGKQSTSASTRSKEAKNDILRTSTTPKNYFTRSRDSPSKNLITTTLKSTISEELQPPPEISRMSKFVNSFEDETFSFLIPPPVRDDNLHYQKKSFESLKTDSSKFHKTSFESFNDKPFKDDFGSNFFKSQADSVTFSPRTEMILEMVQARGLEREQAPSFHSTKPANFLEPPIFKTTVATTFPKAKFSFHGNDNYPYVETLRSIQNSKPTTSSSFGSIRNSHATRTTTTASFGKTHHQTTTTTSEASIFAVPAKPLLSGPDAENDPYYPKSPSTTEAYYTPRHQPGSKSRKPYFTTRQPPTSSAKFEIPAVLPDLNNLEDLLDRRKFFFIPQIKSV